MTRVHSQDKGESKACNQQQMTSIYFSPQPTYSPKFTQAMGTYYPVQSILNWNFFLPYLTMDTFNIWKCGFQDSYYKQQQ